MMRTLVFTSEQLTGAFKLSPIGRKFFVGSKNGKKQDQNEQNRVYACASTAGRQITMRKYREGWKATVIE